MRNSSKVCAFAAPGNDWCKSDLGATELVKWRVSLSVGVAFPSKDRHYSYCWPQRLIYKSIAHLRICIQQLTSSARDARQPVLAGHLEPDTGGRQWPLAGGVHPLTDGKRISYVQVAQQSAEPRPSLCNA